MWLLCGESTMSSPAWSRKLSFPTKIFAFRTASPKPRGDGCWTYVMWLERTLP